MADSVRAAMTFGLRLGILPLFAIVAGCGGGGGGGSKLSISLSPSSVTASFNEGTSYSFQETATVKGSVSGAIYVGIIDKSGVLQPDVSIVPTAANTFVAYLNTVTTLPTGETKGDLQMYLCADPDCANIYGSTILPYDLTVLPGPTIASTEPDSAAAGGPDFTLTVNGANFTANTNLKWNGALRSFTLVSPTQIQAMILAQDIAAAGTQQLTVSADSSSPVTGSVSILVLPPVITTLTPNSAVAAGPGFTLTVDGSSFVPNSVVLWNGSPRATTVVSDTRLTATIPASDIADGGTAFVGVSNGNQAAASTAGFQVELPQPSLTSVSPASVSAIGPGFTLTVDGSKFTPSSVVQWNGSSRSTSFISSSQLTAQIPASDIANGAVVSVTVLNSQADGSGGTSNAGTVTVSNPVPTLRGINGTTAAVGCGAFTLYAPGGNFVPSSTVMWNGSPRPTTLVSTTQVTAAITAADLATAGTGTVKVTNPAPGGGDSAAYTFTINANAPATTDATSFLINPAHDGTAITRCPLTLPAAPAWSITLGGTVEYPVTGGGRIYIASDDNVLTALDPATGNTLWSVLNLNASAPAYENGMLFLVGAPPANSNTSAAVRAYNPADGSVKWITGLPGEYAFNSGVTAFNGVAYTAGSGSAGEVYAVNETDGALLWSYGVANGDDSTPAVTSNGVYVAYPCQAYAIVPLSGATLWNSNGLCDGGGGATPVVGNGAMFAPDGDGSYSGDTFDAITGKRSGTYTASYPPAISGTRGYFNQNGTLAAIDLTNNNTLWTFTGDNSLQTSPIVVNQTVFVGSANGQVYALDQATGQLLWSIQAGTSIPSGASWGRGYTATLAAGADLLLVPTGDRGLTAYKISSEP